MYSKAYFRTTVTCFQRSTWPGGHVVSVVGDHETCCQGSHVFWGHVVSVVLGHGDTLSRTTEIKLNQNKFVRPLKILCVALDKSRETISLKYCIWGNPCGNATQPLYLLLQIFYPGYFIHDSNLSANRKQNDNSDYWGIFQKSPNSHCITYYSINRIKVFLYSIWL